MQYFENKCISFLLFATTLCIKTRVWRMSHTRARKRHYEATRNEQCLVGSGSFSLTDKLFQSLSNMYCKFS